MQPSGSRHIAPAPSPPTRAVGLLSSAPSPNSHAATGIRRASTACQSCKQIKRKCDQAQPCSNCRKSNTRCIYNEAEDGRRKAARKRTVESLELKRDALDSILDAFRTLPDVHAQHLLQLIRSNASLDDIVQYATAHGGDISQRKLQELTVNISDQPRKNVMSVTALCDTPLFRVKASPWTTVTSDDEFVSHLTSLFFTWYHSAYPSVQKDLFIQDMAKGDPNCQFCSSLLVNAMLSLACNFSDHPMSCRIPSDPSTRGQHFFREASRLWTAEEGRPSLVNVQAASFLAVAACLVGKDRLSWSFIEQTNTMIRALELRRGRDVHTGLSKASDAAITSELLASKTAFLLTVGYGIAFMKPPADQLRLDVRPNLPASGTLSTWIPYPQQTPEITFDNELLHEAFYSLHKLGLQIQTLLFSRRSSSDKINVASLEQSLIRWKHTLSVDLAVSDGRNTVRPPILDLHLTYYFFRVTLFTFVKTSDIHMNQSTSRSSMKTSFSSENRRNSSERLPTPATLYDSDRTPTPSSSNSNRAPLTYAQSQLLEAVKSIYLLCGLFIRDYGLKQPSMWMPQVAASAAYSLVDMPIPLQDPEVSDIFHELCSILVASSRRWLVMKGHVRMLFMTAETKGQKIASKTRRLLTFVALDQWGEDDHKKFASSAYPNYALAKNGEDTGLMGMGDLLEIWAGTNIEDSLTPGEEEIIVGDAEDNDSNGETPMHGRGLDVNPDSEGL